MELRGHPQLSRVTGTLTLGLACALHLPTMAVPLSSAPGPRPTGSWAGAHWAKGPATCHACGSAHARPAPSGSPAGKVRVFGGGQCLVRPHLGTEQTPLVFPKPPPESVHRALIAALGGASGSRPMRRRGVSRPSSPPHPPPRGHSDQKRWCPCPVTISDLWLGSRSFLLLTFVCTLVFLSQSLTL